MFLPGLRGGVPPWSLVTPYQWPQARYVGEPAPRIRALVNALIRKYQVDGTLGACEVERLRPIQVVNFTRNRSNCVALSHISRDLRV